MLRACGVMFVVWACVSASPSRANESHLLPTAVSPNASLTAKWQSVQRRIADDGARVVACRAEPWMCSDNEARFESIVDLGRAREGRARIGEINRAVNLAIRPVSDERQFGVVDRWSSPLETVSSGQGDCEDYAILKLLALEQAGISRNELRLVIVRDRASRGAHAVAAVRLDGRWVLLDNRILTLVDLAQTHYRVLAQLEPEADGVRLAASEFGTVPGVM
jgi:predicted transglutaminase-like cysteine proteinase